MKIYVYDVLDFERETLEQLKSNCTDQIELSADHLNMETIERAKGFHTISVIGYSKRAPLRHGCSYRRS